MKHQAMFKVNCQAVNIPEDALVFLQKLQSGPMILLKITLELIKILQNIQGELLAMS